MKINRMVLSIASILALAGCAGSPPQSAPAPHGGSKAPRPDLHSPAPPPPPPPPPPLPATAGGAGAEPASWRDLPQTPGRWTYTAQSNGSAVSFGQPGAAPLLVLRCDRARPGLVLQRTGSGTSDLPATITTSSSLRRLAASPATTAAAPPDAGVTFEIAFAPRDPLLDAIAFSRGRFLFEMAGTQTLVLPVWSELGRVIEDCR